MAVPFFDIQYLLDDEHKRKVLARWEAILDHGRFVNGPEIVELESALSAYLGIPEVVACSNGSDALVLALRAAGVEAGDEVIVPAFTFFATAGSVTRLGATPVFADIDPETFCLDPASAAARVTERTRAVMPVHLYGRQAPIAALREAVDARAGRPITIVEDAAQAVGTVGDEGPCGALGLTAGYSCFPTKNLGAMGDAGFATTTDPERAARMRRLREHGGGRQYYHDEIGWNFRMSGLQAAALLVGLERLPEWTEARRRAAAHYATLISEHGLEPHVKPPAPATGHVFHQYVVRVTERDALRDALGEQQIGAAVYYPLPLHLQPCYRGLGGREGDLPESERAAREVLALPIHPGVTAEQRVQVVEGMASWVRAHKTSTV